MLCTKYNTIKPLSYCRSTFMVNFVSNTFNKQLFPPLICMSAQALNPRQFTTADDSVNQTRNQSKAKLSTT